MYWKSSRIGIQHFHFLFLILAPYRMTTTGTLYDLRIGSSYIEVLLRQVLLGLFEEVRSDAWILFDFNLRGWAFFLSALDLRLFSPPTVWIKYVLHWKKGKRNLVRCWFLPWVFYNWEKDEWRTGCLLSSVGPSLWLVLCSCWTGLAFSNDWTRIENPIEMVQYAMWSTCMDKAWIACVTRYTFCIFGLHSLPNKIEASSSFD